jgi:hypothetical protein
VIHASKSQRYKCGRYADLLPDLPPWDQLDFGALIGVVDVVDCVPVAEVAGEPFADGPWCWILANSQPIKPVQFRGHISFFSVPVRLSEPLGPNWPGS